MHIEETDTPAALRAAGGRHVRHVHLADNTRLEPGTGDIDFVAGFHALRDIGFTGYMAFECGISGGDAAAREAALAKSIEYVRACIAQASA
jgi:sugar phosphate isomerase/epimerase